MQNKALWSAIAVLGVMQLAQTAGTVANFFLSPETIHVVGNQKLGAYQVKLAAVREYKRGGEIAMQKYCSAPVEERSYYFTCSVGGVWTQNYHATTVTVTRFPDVTTAVSAKNRSWSAALKGDILVVSEVDRERYR